jgi:hypothetical protein
MEAGHKGYHHIGAEGAVRSNTRLFEGCVTQEIASGVPRKDAGGRIAAYFGRSAGE